MSASRRILFLVLCGLILSNARAQAADSMSEIAEKYAHLVLALGQHDQDYVDAFYGPPEWKTQAEREKQSLDAIAAGSKELGAKLEQVSAEGEALNAKLGTADGDLVQL